MKPYFKFAIGRTDIMYRKERKQSSIFTEIFYRFATFTWNPPDSHFMKTPATEGPPNVKAAIAV
jgi:hypothetical protein